MTTDEFRIFLITVILLAAGGAVGVGLVAGRRVARGALREAHKDTALLRATLADISYNLTEQTALLGELTRLLRLEAPLRVSRLQRQALLRFLTESAFFTRKEQRDRLLEDLPVALTANIAREDIMIDDLNCILKAILEWGRAADFGLFLDNIRFILDGTRLSDQFDELRRTNGWVLNRPIL